MSGLDKAALDRHITGNYGEDQFDPDYEPAFELMIETVEKSIQESDIDITYMFTNMTEADAHQVGKLLEKYGMAEVLHTAINTCGYFDHKQGSK